MMRRLTAAVCLLLLVPCLWATGLKRIMVVDSYHAEYDWSRDYRMALQDVLRDKAELTFFQMDTKRLPKAQHAARAEAALRLIATEKPDLVITGDDAALKLVGARLAGSRLPVVYLGINQNPRSYLTGNHANVTGVLERPLIRRNILLMKSLIPTLKRALVLFDNDLTSQVIRDELFGGLDSMRFGDVDVDLVMATNYADWQQKIKSAPATYQAVWVGLYQALRDGAGNVVPDRQVIQWTAANSQRPVFGFWDFAIGPNKAAGGMVLSGHDQGVAAAIIAQNILFNHQQPDQIFPVNLGEGMLIFSKSALRRFNLTLPAHLAKDSRLVD